MFSPSRVTVRVPATSANLGPGFDCLGLALKQHNIFEIQLLPANISAESEPLIDISSAWCNDAAIAALPRDQHNLFYRVLRERLKTLQIPVPPMRIRACIDIPPGRGLGSSATAVVGAILAAEALAGRISSPQQRAGLLHAAVELEQGKHADNVAAALLGGLVVVTKSEQDEKWHAIRASIPAGLQAVLFVPDFPMDTISVRALLPQHYTRSHAVHNVGHVALLLAALANGDLHSIGSAMDDRMHEPYRAQIFPQLPDLLLAARRAGAIGACLSGAGSSILALTNGNARAVAATLELKAQSLNLPGRILITAIDHQGATIEVEPPNPLNQSAPEKHLASLNQSAPQIDHPNPPNHSVPRRGRLIAPTADLSARALTNSNHPPTAGNECEPTKSTSSLSPSHSGSPCHSERSEESLPHPTLTLSCSHCNTHFPLTRTDYRCSCGQPLDIEQGNTGEEMNAARWQQRFDARLNSLHSIDRSGVWRFRELLLPLPAITPITRPEGLTNLYPAGRAQDSHAHGRIGEFVGLDHLWVKHEGENPTGSFKDRGMTVAVSIAKWLGATAVACASTGNTSASMAAYAAQAGLHAIVLLPEGKVAAGKLAQAIAYGAEIRHVPGDFDRAMLDVERMCLDQGIYLLNSLNPFRLLGQQSLAFDILQQLHWHAPDWIALPAGNLGNTSALGMGLLCAYRLGIIDRLPRIASIQAAGANPFYASYRDGFVALQPVKAHTLATAINIGNPVSFQRAKTVIQATAGIVAQVSDEEILRAKAIIDSAGIGCEPASAASIAGLKQLTAQGIIHPSHRVVAILTGNLLKDPDAIMLSRQVSLTAS